MKCSSVFRNRIILFPVLLCAIVSLGAENPQVAEKKAREIEDNLIAPCCWSQPVSQHYSEAAAQIRTEVRAMVAAGKSRDEILDHFVAQYGERILATPRPKGFNALAYVLPWAALILGAWLLITMIRKRRSPEQAPSPGPLALPDARYTSIIDKELKDLEE